MDIQETTHKLASLKPVNELELLNQVNEIEAERLHLLKGIPLCKDWQNGKCRAVRTSCMHRHELIEGER